MRIAVLWDSTRRKKDERNLQLHDATVKIYKAFQHCTSHKYHKHVVLEGEACKKELKNMHLKIS